MSTRTLEALAAEARQLISDGRFVEARSAVLAYGQAATADGNESAIENAREFLNWALKAVAVMRSHALKQRSELNRAGVYANSGRRALKTWEMVS